MIDNTGVNNYNNSRWLYSRSMNQAENGHGIINGEWLNTIEKVTFLKVIYKLRPKYWEWPACGDREEMCPRQVYSGDEAGLSLALPKSMKVASIHGIEGEGD